MLCTDSGSGRAQALAEELGGEALASNASWPSAPTSSSSPTSPRSSRRSPREVAPAAQRRRLDPRARHARRSCAPPTPARRWCACSRTRRRGRPRRDAARRAAPRTPLARRGGSCSARVGTVVRLPETLIDAARGLLGRRPRLLGAGRRGVGRRRVRRGIPAPTGAAARRPRRWPAAPRCCAPATSTRSRLRRAVTSPGGMTARGLAALERGGVRAAFAAAMDDVPGARLMRGEHRRLRRRAGPRLHDLHRRLGRASLVFSLGVRVPYKRSSTASWTSCATSRALPAPLPPPAAAIGPLDLTPDGRDHRAADRRRHHRRPDRPEPLISGAGRGARGRRWPSRSWRPTRRRRRSCAANIDLGEPRRRLPGRRARPRAQQRRRVRAVRRRRASCSSSRRRCVAVLLVYFATHSRRAAAVAADRAAARRRARQPDRPPPQGYVTDFIDLPAVAGVQRRRHRASRSAS